MVTINKPFFLALALLLGGLGCHAAQPTPCPKTATHPHDSSTWSASCFYLKGGKRHVKPEYLGAIHTEKRYAVRVEMEESAEAVVINRRGEVVFGGIYLTTNDFEGTNNMHRYHDERGKCGYFHPRSLRIAIPARWDRCYPFREAWQAEVCTECNIVNLDEHDSQMVGGTGMRINRRGQVLQRYANPTSPSRPTGSHQVSSPSTAATLCSNSCTSAGSM